MSDWTLEPPHRGVLWLSLSLTRTQLAELCGVTARRVAHWTRRGYITTASSDPARYNGDAIDQCLLIKQALEQGMTPRRAARLVHAYLANQVALEPGLAALEPTALLELDAHLGQAEALLAAVRQAVAPHVRRHPLDEPPP